MDDKMFVSGLCRYPNACPDIHLFCLAKNEAQMSMHGYTLSRRAEQTKIADWAIPLRVYSICTLSPIGI